MPILAHWKGSMWRLLVWIPLLWVNFSYNEKLQNKWFFNFGKVILDIQNIFKSWRMQNLTLKEKQQFLTPRLHEQLLNLCFWLWFLITIPKNWSEFKLIFFRRILLQTLKQHILFSITPSQIQTITSGGKKVSFQILRI